MYEESVKRGSNELILNPGEYAFLQDNTKGNVQTFVGPIVVTQSGQLRPIQFCNGQFQETGLRDSAERCVSARKGEYLVLENPVDAEKQTHPTPGSNNTSIPNLRFGEKIIVPGPVEFAPWPQQSATKIEGHQLRDDQYLLTRVYDEDAAVANWGDAIVKASGDETVASKTAEELGLSLGQLLVIKDVSFYIPPTGIEVVPDANGDYVRDALTLEMSEYCILVDQNGNKRYEKGPQIVFPTPTEEFYKEDDAIKFKPIELTPTQGLHIKINCDYTGTDATFKEGDEIFITGLTHPIYYPREEHSIIKYGDQVIHFATAVSAGQARYVMDKSTGDITTRHGPDMILLNPTKEVFVTRVLSDSESLVMYPGNQDSLQYNRSLRQFQVDRGAEMKALTSSQLGAEFDRMESFSAGATRSSRSVAKKAALPDQISRKTTYTKPHSVTLDDRFAGAPTLKVWTGFAVLLVKADGDRRVEVGPKVVTLDYDETVGPLHLSTGKPKTTDNLLTTGYLEVANNKVGDILSVETVDGVRVNLKLSYRVSFSGDPKKWFNIDNYVKFLCDNCRSRLKGEARKFNVRGFYTDTVAIVRDTILGKKKKDQDRTGLEFSENGMTITDVEVLDVVIAHHDIAELLSCQQQEVVTSQIEIDRANQSLEVATAKTAVEQEKLKLQDELRQLKHTIELERRDAVATLDKLEAEQDLLRAQEKIDRNSALQLAENVSHEASLKRQTELANLDISQKNAETANVVKRFEAANGDLAAAIRQLGDEQVLTKVAEAMGPMRIIGGGTITEALAGLLGGENNELLARITSLVK